MSASATTAFGNRKSGGQFSGKDERALATHPVGKPAARILVDRRDDPREGAVHADGNGACTQQFEVLGDEANPELFAHPDCQDGTQEHEDVVLEREELPQGPDGQLSLHDSASHPLKRTSGPISLLALYTRLEQAPCLTHIGRDGRESREGMKLTGYKLDDDKGVPTGDVTLVEDGQRLDPRGPNHCPPHRSVFLMLPNHMEHMERPLATVPHHFKSTIRFVSTSPPTSRR